MHPNPQQQRRVHSAGFKAAVLEACQQPGASVAAVALSHGLNVNLVRKWLVGRGLKRSGLTAPRTAAPGSRARLQGSADGAPAVAPSLQFVPLQLASGVDVESTHDAEQPVVAAAAATDVCIELRRGAAHLTIRWPSSQAAGCAAWLRELTTTLLK